MSHSLPMTLIPFFLPISEIIPLSFLKPSSRPPDFQNHPKLQLPSLEIDREEDSSSSVRERSDGRFVAWDVLRWNSSLTSDDVGLFSVMVGRGGTGRSFGGCVKVGDRTQFFPAVDQWLPRHRESGTYKDPIQSLHIPSPSFSPQSFS